MAFFKSGIRSGMPENVNLVSGPGCPVCVTAIETMEKAIRLACRKGTVLFCFGDMMKVPGISGSLESVRAERGANIRVMYSPLEALAFARGEPRKDTVLFGVGFETTIPLFASVLARASRDELQNIYLLAAFKLIPPAIEALLSSADIAVDGFILPGHVSSVIGEESYSFMAERYNVPGVITGFETVDMLEGILLLLDMIKKREPAIRNQYSRFVSLRGNQKAKEIIRSVFTVRDSEWRGLGKIKSSGMWLKDEYSRFDAEALIDFEISKTPEPRGCICDDVIRGKSKPTECKLFKSSCSPSHPVGPCMVSTEGTCAAYYKYGG